jgi:membrane protein
MAIEATPNIPSSDIRRPRGRAGIPLWVTGVTAALLAIGFRPARHAGAPRTHREDHKMSDQGSIARAAGEADRGRLARTPSEIPARGWKDILFRVYANIGHDRVVAIAAGVTFYSILALFPAIAALVSLYGLFADPSSIATHLDSLSGVLPGGAVQVIGDELHRLTTQRNDTLGITFLVGLATALWSANAGMKSLFDALNLVYNEPEKRGLIRLNLVSLAFTGATIGFVMLALAAMIVLPFAFNYLGLGALTAQILRWARWPALFVVVAFGLAVLYRYGPSRAEPRWRWITWGGALAALLWLAASVLFSWYAANFGNYNKTYGSLGAIIGFMVWMWLSTIVILLGAEIDAEMEHQTLRDTTSGPPKPLGRRGATVADTIGPAQD